MRARILNASAGSGKTYQLAYKYVRDVVCEPRLYRHILAVTFTNKATEEMKTRILSELHRLASGLKCDYTESLCSELSLDERTVRSRAAEALSKILHDYSHFTVLTIDKFFQRILRAFIRELGIDLDYNIEIETASILTKSADALVEQITVDDELREWLSAFARERIDESEQWDIRKGILSLGEEIFKESNKQALSGGIAKDELERIAGQMSARAEEARNGLIDTARRAAAIMEQAGVEAADFKGKTRSGAQYFTALAAGDVRTPSTTERKCAMSPDEWCTGSTPPAATALAAGLQPLLAELCSGYDAMHGLEVSAAMIRKNFRSFGLLTDLYRMMRELWKEENVMLLSETKHVLSKFIAGNDAPFIYEKVGNCFERLMIDEFQDTSAQEWRNFVPLLNNALAQSPADDTSVFIVGDVKQSIYRWRGGDWRILTDNTRTDLLPGSARFETLNDNFRSLRRIVEFNNDIMESMVSTDNAALNALLDTAVGSGLLTVDTADSLRDRMLHAYKGHSQKPRRKSDCEGYVRVETYDKMQGPPVIEYIKQALDLGFRRSDIMVLVRRKQEGVQIAEMLLAFKGENSDPRYDFDVMTQEALIIGSSPAACFVIAALRLATDPDDTVSRAIYNRFTGRDVDTPLDDTQTEFFRSIRLLSPEEAFERIVLYENLHRQSSHTAYLQAVHEQILNYCSGRIADIPLFLKWWDEQGCRQSLSVEQSDSTIEILTVHKAKGLEKKVVIIPYCDWSMDPRSNSIVWSKAISGEAARIGDFPVGYKEDMGLSVFSEGYYREKVYSHVDNMNLLYVALTRAKEALYVCIPQKVQRNQTGRLVLDALAGGCGMWRTELADGLIRYESGVASPPAADSRRDDGAQTTRSEKLACYHTSEAGMRLRLPSQRYFDEEDGDDRLSPRDFGILMHRAFEQAATENDIRMAVERMRCDGVVGADDAQTLSDMITAALKDDVIREWFSGQWSEVRTEADIITPHGAGARRPDRVMIRGRHAVVVDYKFGERHAAAYRRQIAEYMRLLRQMGYEDVEGYLWYVKLGRRERVEIENLDNFAE